MSQVSPQFYRLRRRWHEAVGGAAKVSLRMRELVILAAKKLDNVQIFELNG